MAGYVASYVHGEGVIGVLVELRLRESTTARTDSLQMLGKHLAMQIASMQPIVIWPREVSHGLWEKELHYFTREPSFARLTPVEQTVALEKARQDFERNFCLMKQAFILDSSKTVEEHIRDVETELLEQIEVVRFTRYKVDELS